jgi:hypothetical protein
MRSVSSLMFVSLVGALAACAPDGSSAYVSYNVQLTEDCQADPTALPLATGRYDVTGGDAKSACVNSYFMNLLINSNLKANAQDSTGRAEPNVLQITHADVRLMDRSKATLQPVCKSKSATCTDADVKDGKVVDVGRPNPYRVQTATSLPPTTGSTPSSSIATIEAIPKAYAEQLTAYAGDSVLLEIQLFGTTTGDLDIDFRTFLYPIAICAGCMSRCNSDMVSTDVALPSQCKDNRAQDDFTCISPDC